MTKIKICGIQDIETACVAVECGVDFIGLVFAPSHRQISLTSAHIISKAVHDLDSQGLTTGVFVNQPAKEVNSIARRCSLDYVQLSGDESWEYCRNIEKPIIKAIHVSSKTTGVKLITDIQKTIVLLRDKEIIHLLDSDSPNSYGGTGEVFNWDLLKPIADEYDVMIAGGLNAHNVAELIKSVNPWGVDVSSGVEINGIKNPERIKKFIDTVRKLERKEQ